MKQLKTLLSICLILLLSSQIVNAQISDPSSFDLQFTNPVFNSNNTLCVDIQIKATEGSPDLAIGSHTIWFNYNLLGLSNPVYTPFDFYEETECIITETTFYSPYSTTNFSYSELDEVTYIGEANFTSSLAGFITGFECPVISSEWITMGEVCFEILDVTQSSGLNFDYDFTLCNLSSNLPEHEEGTFTGLDISLLSEVCSISILNVEVAECDPETDEFMLAVEVSYSNPPSPELLINDFLYEVSSMISGVETFFITGLAADGSDDAPVTVQFQEDPFCGFVAVDAYDAPAEGCTCFADAGTVDVNGSSASIGGTQFVCWAETLILEAIDFASDDPSAVAQVGISQSNAENDVDGDYLELFEIGEEAMVSNANGYPNNTPLYAYSIMTNTSLDCTDVSEPSQPIVLLEKIIVNNGLALPVEDNGDGTITASVEIEGGLPNYDGSNSYTVNLQNFETGEESNFSVAAGETFTVVNTPDEMDYFMTIEDGTACVTAGNLNLFAGSFINFTGDTFVGIDDVAEGTQPTQNIKAYPNPANDQLFIQVQSNSDRPLSQHCALYDINGRQLFSQVKQNQTANATWQLDLSTYPQGMYVVRIESNNGQVSSQRVLISR